VHSAKNTVVAILLLGVSYGVYQVINAPAGGDPLAGLMRMNGDPAASEPPAAATGDDDWNTAALPPPPSSFPPLSAGLTLDESSAAGAGDPPPSAAIPALTPPAQPAAAPLPPLSTASISFPPSGNSTNTPVPAPFVAPTDERLGQLPSAPAPTTQFQPPAAPPTRAFVTAPVPGNATTSTAAPSTTTLDAAWPEAEKQVAAGNYRGALELLSPWHERTAATDPGRDKLNQWLDALAGKVVYSIEHHLDPVPHIVKQGETLDSIAEAWSVPAQLVYNINQQKIPNPIELTPGTELKKVRGPFNAVVHAGQRELTLYVNSLYAGRFPLAAAPTGLSSGSWQIADKKEAGHTCGPYCLQLNQPGLALHAADAASGAAGGLAFQTADAKDLFNILTVGSTVSIR
jgi:LysM repeat protein